jgi:hypothetical protein
MSVKPLILGGMVKLFGRRKARDSVLGRGQVEVYR